MIDTMGDAGAAETPVPDIAAAEIMQGASSGDRSKAIANPGLRAAGGSRYDGSLHRLYRANDIQYRPKQRPVYSKDDVLNELRRVAPLVAHPVLTFERFHVHSRMGWNVVLRRFGLWRTALERAGLAHRYSGRPITDKFRRRVSKTWSNDALLAELRAIAAASGRDTVTVKQINASRHLSVMVFYKRFGPFRNALLAAGLRPSRFARRYSEAECFANLEATWRHHGRPPRQVEMGRAPSTIAAHVYIKRHGTWRRALTAFALRRNAGGAYPPFAAPDPDLAQRMRDEERRGARPGLRLGVMQRDRFRCVLCGDNPAANPGCVLQVDHVLPFSRGGRTEASNLRTLCRTCNLGRGNRVEAG